MFQLPFWGFTLGSYRKISALKIAHLVKAGNSSFVGHYLAHPQFFLIAKMLGKIRRGEPLAEDSQATPLSRLNTERSMGKGHPVTTRACSIKEKSKSGLMKPRRGVCPCDWNPSLKQVC